MALSRASCAIGARSSRLKKGQSVFPGRSWRGFSDHCCGEHATVRSCSQAVAEAAHVLPNQAILENFIHQNPLKHFEFMEFRAAVEHVHHLEQYATPGERVLERVGVDPRKRAHEALVDLSAAFLDRGAAKWAPQFRDRGFLYFFATLENLGFAPWRTHARQMADRVLGHMEMKHESADLAEAILRENLTVFDVPAAETDAAIRNMLLEVRGWAGMFRRMETHPSECPPGTDVRLLEFAAVQSILLRSSIEALAFQLGWDAELPLSKWLSSASRKEEAHPIGGMHPSAIAFADQSAGKREDLEAEFESKLLHAIGNQQPGSGDKKRPMLQLLTCIDDRECSFRRHIEESDPELIETFGVAGFFGIPIRFQPSDGRDQMILAPEGNNPPACLIEGAFKADEEKAAEYDKRRKQLGTLNLWWENASFSPIGSLVLSMAAPFTLARLWLMGFAPNTSRNAIELLRHRFLDKPRTDFQLPFSAEHAARLLASTMKDIGLNQRFAKIVMVLGHGAVSNNNPFFAAYNCGACGGREGGPNARLWARLANDKDVRALLLKNHDIAVPEDTVFVGGLHNTTADSVEFFDLEVVPESLREEFLRVTTIIERGRRENALERCTRFLLAKKVQTADEALAYVQTRSTDAAEVRPELNHATNAGVVVGRRELTKGLFLDRRVFLPSYNPLYDDARGTNLEHVVAPALIVCSGINLEYLFSTIEADSHGAGTKAPLNIVGNVGVLQGTAGDLRPGLPAQMTEMHVPIRALFVIDAPIATLEAVLARREELRKIVRNEWVRLVVRDPATGMFFKQSNGNYLPLPVDESQTGTHVSFEQHRLHGLKVAKREAMQYWAGTATMVAGCIGPVVMFGAQSLNPFGSLIAVCGTALALPVLAFARRYLHGEFMFARFSMLCSALVVGFNLIATAPNLALVLSGWNMFGLASTFLIGMYNERPTVRNNATFAFAAYEMSDFALLVAMTFGAHNLESTKHGLAAGGLIAAAMLKSSQFPMTALFVRSMEGPTPASALGYAGLSAHVGVVLLTSTMDIWYHFDWARMLLGGIGLATAVHASMVGRIRSDRKGAVANATSATIGLIFVTLALGHPDIALLMSFGHATFRIVQILRSPNILLDTQNLKSALRRMPWPEVVPGWLYRLAWRLRRFHSDFNFMHLVHLASRFVHGKPWQLSKWQQWLITAALVGTLMPFTPLSHWKESLFEELLQTHPYLAVAAKAVDLAISVVLLRILFVNVLKVGRFRKPYHK